MNSVILRAFGSTGVSAVKEPLGLNWIDDRLFVRLFISIFMYLYLPDNLPDEASPGDWLGLRSQADLNSPINDSSLCSLFK